MGYVTLEISFSSTRHNPSRRGGAWDGNSTERDKSVAEISLPSALGYRYARHPKLSRIFTFVNCDAVSKLGVFYHKASLESRWAKTWKGLFPSVKSS